MSKLRMTYQIAHAVATDAANRNMRADGRSVWSVDDYAIAAETMERVYPVEQELRDQMEVL